MFCLISNKLVYSLSLSLSLSLCVCVCVCDINAFIHPIIHTHINRDIQVNRHLDIQIYKQSDWYIF